MNKRRGIHIIYKDFLHRSDLTARTAPLDPRLGRQNGRQVVFIGEGCETKKTVIHELLNTLGIFHEQTRMDRGLYVRILWWNLQRGAEQNFQM